MDVRIIARVMGGSVRSGAAIVPGPGHKPHDRSLRVFADPNAPDGFYVHSFANDDPIQCRDYVRQKMGLPAWQPSKQQHNPSNSFNGNSKTNGTRLVNGTQRAQRPCDSALPNRTPLDAAGKPKFYPWGDDGPPRRSNEARRHVYRRDGVPVRIKIKNTPGGDGPAFVNWYRVHDGDVTGWQAKKPDSFQSVPYIGAINPFDSELADDTVFWPEGEKDCDTLGNKNLPAFTLGGCGDGLPDAAAEFLSKRHIVILADNDDAGRDHAEKKAALAHGAASVRIVHFLELPAHGDVTDFFKAGGTVEKLMQRAEAAPLWCPPQIVENIPPKETNGRALVILRASDIEMTPVAWLWLHKLALGKLSLIAGEPGLGKSQLTAALAAVMTTGGLWPCSSERAPLGNVVIFSAEDDPSDTVVPRLKAAGADLERVRIVSSVESGAARSKTQHSFNLQTDLVLLELAITNLGDVRLIIIDPITSYLGKVDSHKNAEIRSVLEPVAQMAVRRGVAVVGVTHFSKGGGTSAINRFIGSIGFIAAARAAFVVTADPESDDPARRLFIPVKNNLAPKGDGLSFRIEQQLLENGILVSRIEWGNEAITRTADEILQAIAGDGDSPARTEAEDFLRTILANGERLAKEIEAEAKEAGISWRTVRRAQKALGIRSYRKAESGDGLGKAGHWYWSLPDGQGAPKMAKFSYDGHVPDVATLGNFGHLRDEGGEL
jgi:putative DNA primase/helicase